MKVLLAFLNYNTSSELEVALKSVPSAMEGADCDVLILDNASPKPGEIERIRALKGDYGLLELPKNLGFAGAFNHVLPPEKGDYDYVLLLNSDLVLPKGFVGDLLEAVKDLKDLGLAGVRLVREDGSPQFSYGPTPTLLSELTNRSLAQKSYVALHPANGKHMKVESVLGAVMLVSLAAVKKAGAMDSGFFFFFEETEWCCRMRDFGYGVYHVPSVTATHLQGRAANKTPLRARVEFHRSRRRFFLLRKGRPALWILTAGTVARLFVNFCAQAAMCLLTLFRKEKFLDKAALYFGLLKWYLSGCPEKAGLDQR